jgi:hypothetical protein
MHFLKKSAQKQYMFFAILFPKKYKIIIARFIINIMILGGILGGIGGEVAGSELGHALGFGDVGSAALGAAGSAGTVGSVTCSIGAPHCTQNLLPAGTSAPQDVQNGI